MDEKTGNQRKKMNGDFIGLSQEAPKFGIRMSPERIPEYRAIVQKHIKDYKADAYRFEKAKKSFWTDKTHLKLATWLADLDVVTSVNFWSMMYSLDYVETRLANLESIVQGIAEKVNVDLSSLKAQVDTLHKTIKEPMFAELNEYVQTMKDVYNRRKQAGEEYVE
jgi:hypothetical protein